MDRALETTAPAAKQPQSDHDVVAPRADLLSGPQVRAILGISASTLLRWRATGEFPQPITTPGHPRWRKSDIERFKNGSGRFFSAHRRTQQPVTRGF